jgi:hypothetical protein
VEGFTLHLFFLLRGGEAAAKQEKEVLRGACGPSEPPRRGLFERYCSKNPFPNRREAAVWEKHVQTWELCTFLFARL